MIRRCCVPNCPTKRQNFPNVLYHPFPPQDQEIKYTNKRGLTKSYSRRSLWVAKLKTQIGPSSRVCSRHFTKNDYETKGSRTRLRLTAVPSRFLPVYHSAPKLIINLTNPTDNVTIVNQFGANQKTSIKQGHTNDLQATYNEQGSNAIKDVIKTTISSDKITFSKKKQEKVRKRQKKKINTDISDSDLRLISHMKSTQSIFKKFSDKLDAAAKYSKNVYEEAKLKDKRTNDSDGKTCETDFLLDKNLIALKEMDNLVQRWNEIVQEFKPPVSPQLTSLEKENLLLKKEVKELQLKAQKLEQELMNPSSKGPILANLPKILDQNSTPPILYITQ